MKNRILFAIIGIVVLVLGAALATLSLLWRIKMGGGLFYLFTGVMLVAIGVGVARRRMWTLWGVLMHLIVAVVNLLWLFTQWFLSGVEPDILLTIPPILISIVIVVFITPLSSKLDK